VFPHSNVIDDVRQASKRVVMFCGARDGSNLLLLTILEDMGVLEHEALLLSFGVVSSGAIRDGAQYFEGKFERYLDGFFRMAARKPVVIDMEMRKTAEAAAVDTYNVSQAILRIGLETGAAAAAESDCRLSLKSVNAFRYAQGLIVFAQPGMISYLNEVWGLKSFHPFIDESYDNETNPVERAILVAQEISRILRMSSSEFEDFYAKIKPIIMYNSGLIQSSTFLTSVIDKSWEAVGMTQIT
jgi:hypothetical protein